MCFKTLPVQFDSRGNASLRGGIPNPYDVGTSKPDVAVTEQEREQRIQRLWPGTGTSRI